MTAISTSDVQRLAMLSSLQLTEEAAEGLRQDLEHIIGYINQLGQLDTSGVEPTYQVTGLQNVWREDDVRSGVSREALLGLAPEQTDHHVKVPQVL